jgi:hypothetical protein
MLIYRTGADSVVVKKLLKVTKNQKNGRNQYAYKKNEKPAFGASISFRFLIGFAHNLGL